MKILVTGANGQLGSDIKRLATDHPSWEFRFIDIQDVDLTNRDATVSFFKGQTYDWVINTAAYTAVDQAESDPAGAKAGNVLLVQNLIECIQTFNGRLVHLSTDYVFDGTNTRPYTEDDIPNPQTVYGQTKWAGEKVALAYEPTLVVRTSWLYSSFGHNFLKRILNKARKGDDLRVVDDQHGTPTYAGHLAEAILTILDNSLKGMPIQFGVFHFSNSGFCSWFEFARAILAETKLHVSLKPIKSSEFPTPAKRPTYSVLSTKKIMSKQGLTIPHWRQGLKECLGRLEPE